MSINLVFLGLFLAEIALVIILVSWAYYKHKSPIFDYHFHTKKKRKVYKSIVFLTYLIAVTVIIYLMFLVFNPGSFLRDEYVINEKSISKPLSSFYIDNKNILVKDQYNNENVLRITSPQAFNIVFRPETQVINKSAQLTINIFGGESEFYLDNKLIVPNLANYTLIKTYPDAYVFVRNDINTNSYEDKTISDDFIYSNFKTNKIYSFKDISNYNPDINNFNQETTNINIAFRDSLKLAIYAEDQINLDFTKQDLNWYLGQDEYTITIKNSKQEIVFNQTYLDDGEIRNTNIPGNEQIFNINIPDITPGIYTIEFQKDKFNDASDSTIKNIRINTNKLIFLDRILPWQSNTQFYIKSNGDDQIKFNYWWGDKDQVIEITGSENINVDLNKSWFEKRYDQNLTQQGDYFIKIDKGFLWVFANALSPNKENWFDIIKPISNINEAEIIVIDGNNLEIDENEFIYTMDLNLSSGDKFKLKVLEGDKYYIKEIKLIVN